MCATPTKKIENSKEEWAAIFPEVPQYFPNEKLYNWKKEHCSYMEIKIVTEFVTERDESAEIH